MRGSTQRTGSDASAPSGAENEGRGRAAETHSAPVDCRKRRREREDAIEGDIRCDSLRALEVNRVGQIWNNRSVGILNSGAGSSGLPRSNVKSRGRKACRSYREET